MNPFHKTQKKTDFEKTFLYLMLKGNIWPLVARKRPKKGFLGPRNKVLPVLWPPEAKNDSLSENTKNTDFEKNFLVYSPKRSFSASGGRKTENEMIFGSPE